ncbi:MAG: hypothetical protein WCH98_22380, partial [Verrucomicrobiota bacterium]
MRFAALEWFLLVPVAIFVAWRWPALNLRSPRRAALVILLLLVLVQPEIRRIGPGLDLWVLVDRSASASEAIESRRAEMEGLIERAKGADDRLYFVDFAKIAQLRCDSDPIPEPQRQETRMSLAIETTLARLDPDRASRLLVLTDGASTEPLSGLGERLRASEAPLDYRLLSAGEAGDYRVSKLVLPSRVQPGEPFLIEIAVEGSPDGTVPCDIERDEKKIGTSDVVITHGRGHLRFTDRLARPGGAKYTARLRPEADARPGNNFLDRWIEVGGGPRILLVTKYPDDPLEISLRAQGFAVETVTRPSDLHVGRLSGARVVILNNV